MLRCHAHVTIVFCLNMALVLFHFGVTRISILRWGVFNLAAFDFHLAKRFFHLASCNFHVGAAAFNAWRYQVFILASLYQSDLSSYSI